MSAHGEHARLMPTHAVTDTRDAYTWARDMHGQPFTQDTAQRFADAMTEGGTDTYTVSALVPQHYVPELRQALGRWLDCDDDGQLADLVSAMLDEVTESYRRSSGHVAKHRKD